MKRPDVHVYHWDGAMMEVLGKLPRWCIDDRRRELRKLSEDGSLTLYEDDVVLSQPRNREPAVLSLINDRFAETEGLIERLFDLLHEGQRKIEARLSRIEALLNGEE
jgi:hypothetical protein